MHTGVRINGLKSPSRSSAVLASLLLLGGCFLLAEQPPVSAQSEAGTIIVNSTDDAGDTSPLDGACDVAPDVEGEQCTLRGAIETANGRAGADNIFFSIPGNGVQTILLKSGLPPLVDASGPTVIDGYTQPGATPNTAPLASNAGIMVQIEGAGAGMFDGLKISSSGNVVRGLALYKLNRAVLLLGTDVRNNRVVGNFIGTDARGEFRAPKPSGSANGVHIAGGGTNTSIGNTIGGTSPADRNVISGNAGLGVGLFDRGTRSNVVSGNLIGLSPAGDRNLGNGGHGVDINAGAAYNVVGGMGAGARNVISGNRNSGVEISHGPNLRDNRVEGNFIGTSIAGEYAPAYTANGIRGVNVEDGASSTVVRNNVIGNNRLGGVKIMGRPTVGSLVYGNRIGVSPGGRAIPNGVSGVEVSNNSKRSRIGPGNVISNNPVGVRILHTDTDGHAIFGNSIYGNTGRGIDVEPWGRLNANDPMDRDSGPNQQQNRPSLVSANSFSGMTVVKGSLHSVPRRTYLIQFFSNPAGTDEGKTYIGSKKVPAGAAGNAAFSFYPARMIRPGQTVTATATDPYGNISEFSLAQTVRRGR